MINIFKNFNIFWHKNLVIHYPCSLPKSYDFDGFRQQKIVNTYHHRITNFSTILLTLFRSFSTTFSMLFSPKNSSTRSRGAGRGGPSRCRTSLRCPRCRRSRSTPEYHRRQPCRRGGSDRHNIQSPHYQAL